MEIRPIEPGDGPALERFFDAIPDARPHLPQGGRRRPGRRRRLGAARATRARSPSTDGEVVGYVAVVPLHGWSSHVGEVRLVVDPDHRGRGIGRALARQAVLDALDLGLAKLVVEVIADQEALIAHVPRARLRARGAAGRPRARSVAASCAT